MKHFFRVTVALTAILCGWLIATTAFAQDLRFIMITHGEASDSFWAPVKKGAEDAGALVGVTISYQTAGVDMVGMNNLIRSAMAQEADGLIVTVPDIEALADSIREAVEAGIPTVSINSGTGTQDRTGTMFFVGEDLYVAGVISGQRLNEIGGTKAACLNVQPGNVALDAICNGLNDGFGSPAKVVPFNFDPAEVAAKTRAILESDPDINALLSMSTTNAPVIADLIEEMGLAGKVHHSTFNLSKEVLEYIRDGRIDFTIDQQPYLQGYLPVIALNLKARYGIEIIADHVGSGPLVIDASNAAEVIEGTAGGYR